MKLWFGKYYNEEIEDIPTDYLVWLLEEYEPSNSKVHVPIKEIEAELTSREKYGQV